MATKLTLCFILMVSTMSIAKAAVESDVEALFSDGNEKLAKIHFYMQEYEGGPNQTAYEVAHASITSNSSSSFGLVMVLDNFITARPEVDSTLLGRVQGHVSFSDLRNTSLVMNLGVVFTSGEYSGSSLFIIGRNPVTHAVREFAVVGGTGVFRLARGYVVSSTYSIVGYHLVLEYTVYTTYNVAETNQRLRTADM